MDTWSLSAGLHLTAEMQPPSTFWPLQTQSHYGVIGLAVVNCHKDQVHFRSFLRVQMSLSFAHHES